MSIDSITFDEIKLFEIKCNQDIVKYQKNNIFKIFFKYYIKVIVSSFFLRKRFTAQNRDGSMVVSYIPTINRYNYLKQYKYHKVYKDIENGVLFLLKEFYRIPFYFIQYLTLKSMYKNQIFEAYLNSQILINHIEMYNIKQVVFLGYDYDLTFFYSSLLLKKKNIKVTQYCNSGFLGTHNLVSVDKIYCRTTIHKEYMRKRKDIFNAHNISSLFQFPRNSKNIKENKQKIALYTSGFYERIKLNFSNKEYIMKGINAERKMIKTLKKYATLHKNIEIVLFIHLHNNIENFRNAKIEYADFLKLENVRLQKNTENSLESFGNFKLGICCMSEIFFDRYERGYKTILLNPFILDDFINNTNLKRVTCYSVDNNINDKINYFLNINKNKFINLLENTK